MSALLPDLAYDALLPTLASAAVRQLRGLGYTSANGVPGTIGADGFAHYSGAVLGLPFDVSGNPGEPVYGPLFPSPGQPVMQASPYNGPVNTQAPITTQSTYTPPAAPVDTNTTPGWNPGAAATCPAGSAHRSPNPGEVVLTQLADGSFCVAPAAAPAPTPAPAPADPQPEAPTIGKPTGDTFDFSRVPSGLQSLFALYPWYAWAGGAAALLLLLAFAMQDHKRGNRRR
jgi:hypothetical protein